MRTIVRAIGSYLLAALLVTGCGNAATPNSSNTPSETTSPTNSASACSATDQVVKIKETKWQVCLPTDVNVTFTRSGSEVTATVLLSSGQEIETGKYQIWSPANPAPSAEADSWIEVATNRESTLVISAEQEIPGDLAAEDLRLLSRVISDYLGDAGRYSVAP